MPTHSNQLASLVLLVALPLFAQQGGVAGPKGIVGTSGIVSGTYTGPAVTILGSCDSGNAASLTSSCTSSGAGAAGDLVFITSKAQNTGTTGTMTPAVLTGCGDPRVSGTNQWVQIPPNTTGTGQALDAAAAYCVLTASSTPAVTVVWSGVNAAQTETQAYVLHSNKGWNPTVLDRYITTVTASGSTCPTGSTNTTTNANDYVLVVCRTNATNETWATNPSGYTLISGGNVRTGVFSQLVNATGAQGATVALSTNAPTNSMALSLQTGAAVSGVNGVYEAGVNDSGQTVNYDQPTLSGFKNGSIGVYFGWYDNAATNGAVTMTDQTGRNVWCPFNNYPTGCSSVGGTATENSLTVGGGYSMYAFVGPGIINGNGVSSSLTYESVASDCSVSCATFIGGTGSEWSVEGGIIDGFCNSASGATSTTTPNNLTCSGMTTTAANDLIICGIKVPSGATVTAGTTPASFAIQTQSPAGQSNGLIQSAVWSGSGSTTVTATIASSGVSYGMMCFAIK
jgi:hypothetical protein